MSTSRFAPHAGADVVKLVAENPLGWIFLEDSDGLFATAAPLRPGAVSELPSRIIGHVPRRSRIGQCLATPQRALILVLGPHGYVSPSWFNDRTQAPTWNYTSAQFVADIRLVDDPAFLEQHLRDLTEAQEANRIDAWGIDEMGPRFDKLAARIVAFEARIVSCDSRFKLGQDESDRTFREIVQALAREGRSSEKLRLWMQQFNAARD